MPGNLDAAVLKQNDGGSVGISANRTLILSIINDRVDHHAAEYKPRRRIVEDTTGELLTFCNNFIAHVVNKVLYGTEPRELQMTGYVFGGPIPRTGPREKLFYASEQAARIDHPQLVNEIVTDLLDANKNPDIWKHQKLTDGLAAGGDAMTQRFEEWQAFADEGQLVLIVEQGGSHGHIAVMLPGEKVEAVSGNWTTAVGTGVKLPLVASAGAPFGTSSPQAGEWISKRIAMNWVYNPASRDNLHMFRRDDLTQAHAWLTDSASLIRKERFDPSLTTRKLLWEEATRTDVRYSGEPWQETILASRLGMDDAVPAVRVKKALLNATDNVEIEIDGTGKVLVSNELGGASIPVTLPATLTLGPAANCGIFGLTISMEDNVQRRGALFITQGATAADREAALLEMPIERTGENLDISGDLVFKFMGEIERSPDRLKQGAEALFTSQFVVDNLVGWSIDGVVCAAALAGTAGGGAFVCLKSLGVQGADMGYQVLRKTAEFIKANPDPLSVISPAEVDELLKVFNFMDIARVGLSLRGFGRDKKMCDKIEAGLNLGAGGAKLLVQVDKDYDDIRTGRGVARLLIQYVFESATKATLLVCKTAND